MQLETTTQFPFWFRQFASDQKQKPSRLCCSTSSMTTGSQTLESRFWHPVAGPNDCFGRPRGKQNVGNIRRVMPAMIFRGKHESKRFCHFLELLRVQAFGDLIQSKGIETCFKARREDVILILKIASLGEAYCSICN
jgi:hypothetical protein